MDILAALAQQNISSIQDSNSDGTILEDQVAGALAQARSEGKLGSIAQLMVDHIGVDHLLPDCYAKFQPVVTESMVYLLQQLPLERLTAKIEDQLSLNPDASRGERLCTLIKDMPSLQKLGQIICRSPGLAPEFKAALVSLEDNVDTVRYSEVAERIEHETKAAGDAYRIDIEPEILAEASVCVVVGATLREKAGSGEPVSAVLKLVKQHVRDHLAHELDLLNQLALFLDRNKTRWELGDFKFEATLQQVQWLLENEVNLEIEQANLDAAGRYFPSLANLSIPERLGCSTPTMTAMTRIEGTKITDVSDLAARERRRLANALAETCIVRPVKGVGDTTLFHGDPHAGNIAYAFEGAHPRIIFYDWGMMGRLNRLERLSMALMAIGVVLKSQKIVLLGADIASAGQISSSNGTRADVDEVVQKVLDKRPWGFGDVLVDINTLMEEITYQGIVFPANLLMFQKAMVTLKGVIADVDPEYDNDQLIWIALGSHLHDLRQPRYYWSIYKELWAWGRFSTVSLVRYQRLMLTLFFELGAAGCTLLMPKLNRLKVNRALLKSAS